MGATTFEYPGMASPSELQLIEMTERPASGASTTNSDTLSAYKTARWSVLHRLWGVGRNGLPNRLKRPPNSYQSHLRSEGTPTTD